MKFGYFTLSDNHYADNTRAPNQFVADIIDEALYAETVGHALGVDRRASFRHAWRAVVPRPGARLYRRAHAAHPAGAGGDRAAAASSDPRRGTMGEPRSAERRARRFRRRPRLRPQRIPPARRVVRRQPVDLRGGHGDRAPPVVGRGADLASRPALRVRRCGDHAAAGAAADPGVCRIVLQAVDRACGAAGLRPDRRAVRRGDDLRRAAPGARSVSRDLREAWHDSRAG